MLARQHTSPIVGNKVHRKVVQGLRDVHHAIDFDCQILHSSAVSIRSKQRQWSMIDRYCGLWYSTNISRGAFASDSHKFAMTGAMTASSNGLYGYMTDGRCGNSNRAVSVQSDSDRLHNTGHGGVKDRRLSAAILCSSGENSLQ